MAPGTYTTAPFLPEFTFTIASEWKNDRAWPHGGEIALADGAIQWASGVKVGVVEGVNEAIGPTVDDFIAHMRKQKSFTISDASPVTIDGVSGLQIDVLTNQAGVNGVFKIEEDNMNLSPGEKIRLYVLDKGGQTVILTMDAFKAEEFDAFATVAQPVIDSVHWVP